MMDFHQAMLRVPPIGALLENRTLVDAVADAHRLIGGEARRVGRIQRTLLPDPLPRISGLEIAASYETFGEAGGDLYDFIPLLDPTSAAEQWAVFIGDASGHGVAAAVVIAIVQALLHAHPPGVTSPAALLRHLNEHLCRRPIENSFVTAFLGIYEASSQRFTFACAGHPPPILLATSAPVVKFLDCVGGYPLGIDGHQTFCEASIALGPGDSLLLYTDGIPEARDQSGAMFGIQGIQAAIRRCSGAPQQLISNLRQAITSHENGRRPTDDQTLVALRVV